MPIVRGSGRPRWGTTYQRVVFSKKAPGSVRPRDSSSQVWDPSGATAHTDLKISKAGFHGKMSPFLVSVVVVHDGRSISRYGALPTTRRLGYLCNAALASSQSRLANLENNTYVSVTPHTGRPDRPA